MNSGIYCLLNTVNGKRYIGQTVNLSRRISEHVHRLKNGNHKNEHLQNAFEIHGEKFFDFLIIETVSIDLLDQREHFWISHYKSTNRIYGYNCQGGGSYLKSLSPETRKAISDSHKGIVFSEEHRRRISESKKGCPLTITEKRRKANLARRGVKRSAETCRKMSIAMTGRPRSKLHCQRLSESHIGKVPSLESRLKVSISLKGRIFSEEHRKRLSEASFKRWAISRKSNHAR